MKKLTFILFLMFLCLNVLFAQLKVANSGNVGIKLGTNTPLSALSINGVGSSNTMVDITGNTNGLNIKRTGDANYHWTYGIIGTSDINAYYNVGIRGQSYSASPLGMYRAWGLFGLAGNSSSGYNYGVFGTTYGSQNGAGIVGTVGNNQDVYVDSIYAGYFVGDVKVIGNVKATGLINGIVVGNSDSRYKKNIVHLESKKTLDNLLLLNPVEYNLEQLYREYKSDTTQVRQGVYDEKSQLFTKKHFGLIAQELQQTYPELVYENTDGYLSVDYTGLIPLLIQSIKELKSEIESLKAKSNDSPAKIGDVKTGLNETDALTYPVLDQNIPNPFDIATTIGFYLPKTITAASIYVYDMNGGQLKSYTINERGKGNITIQGSEFNPGMYLYALITDSKVIDTKRMILTK